MEGSINDSIVLSIIIPCFNEERTLATCVQRVLNIADESLFLEIIIVDDHSTDDSFAIAHKLRDQHPGISVLRHKKNQGKGAAVQTGLKQATGDFVAIQDADLEYHPMELKLLLVPLINNDADMVIGSRFLSTGFHRVLYFWHYIGNRFLTLLSNMFTDLNLTDIESCYKVFRREVIQSVDLRERGFGIEPEIIAKIAHKRLRIFEIGISYYGRTFEEGKKIGIKDGFRALYCIFHYNAHKLPWPMQFILYLTIGGTSALVNLVIFLVLFSLGSTVLSAALIAFVIAAIINYFLCIAILFRHQARWSSCNEILIYLLVVSSIGLLDAFATKLFWEMGATPGISKIIATGLGVILNFVGRKFLVFPEPPSGPWKPQVEVAKNEIEQIEKDGQANITISH